jgi:hypothetical protein
MTAGVSHQEVALPVTFAAAVIATFTWRAVSRLLAPVWLGIMLSAPAMVARADTGHFQPNAIADQTICRLVESAARFSSVPVDLLTRLVWIESRFRSDVTSSAGAQGIAQFMPETAAQRGLANPFDPEQAIPEAASFFADLTLRFGNIGLAAAAYNVGSARVDAWLAGLGSLPSQTHDYVLALTGRPVEDWAADKRERVRFDEPSGRQSCLDIATAFRAREGGARVSWPTDIPLKVSLWESAAIVSFERARQRYCRTLRRMPPLITGKILPDHNPPFYRMAAPTLQAQQDIRDMALPPLCASFIRP